MGKRKLPLQGTRNARAPAFNRRVSLIEESNGHALVAPLIQKSDNNSAWSSTSFVALSCMSGG